jgi:hypothetical protein
VILVVTQIKKVSFGKVGSGITAGKHIKLRRKIGMHRTLVRFPGCKTYAVTLQAAIYAIIALAVSNGILALKNSSSAATQ